MLEDEIFLKKWTYDDSVNKLLFHGKLSPSENSKEEKMRSSFTPHPGYVVELRLRAFICEPLTSQSVWAYL